MAQRRNSSGRSDDLDDTKALAAKARSNTGGPVAVQNPAELSGVRPRRDSVIGARLTPPPRATSSELPNWFFGTLGFLTVLLVGFGGLFVLGRSGKLDALLGEAGPVAAPAPAAPAPSAPSAEPAPAPTAAAPPSAAPAPAAPVPAEHAPAKAPSAENPPADENLPSRGPGRHDHEHDHLAAGTPSKSRSGKSAEPGAPAAADDQGDEAPAAAAAAAKPARAAAPKPAESDESDDDQAAPGQDAVEAALDALATRVRGCFVKYQIKGTARVRLVATPAGTAESVNVTGDFEDTPTGLCVEAVVSGAKLPSFKGPPLKLSQSYQLR